MIASSPVMLYSKVVKKLSFWRRLRQLSYLLRLGKCQIKRSRQDSVWWSRQEREGRKGPSSSKACHFCHREGHWKNNYKHRQEWLKKKGQAAEAGVALSGLEEIEVLIATYEDNTSQGSWIFDLFSTVHVCS